MSDGKRMNERRMDEWIIKERMNEWMKKEQMDE